MLDNGSTYSKYDNISAEKQKLDQHYQDLIDGHDEMKVQMHIETDALYSKYRDFKDKKSELRENRNKLMKRILQSASISNQFLGNVAPKKFRKAPKLELNPDGLVVEDDVKEIKKKKLMGMKNLDDLEGLDIERQLEKRQDQYQKNHSKYFKKVKVNGSFKTERNLSDIGFKNVEDVKSPSFFIRNKKGGLSKEGSFKPERGLYDKGIDHSSKKAVKETSRKLKKKKKKKKKKKAKKAKKKKKIPKIYKFDWKTLTWKVTPKYKYGLIKSLKELKFWKAMGFKIKKQHPKLFYRFDRNRKYLKTQAACVLSARFVPLVNWRRAKQYFLKATFKSNCKKYTAEKLFQISNPRTRSFKIYIANFSFTVAFHSKKRRHGSTFLYKYIKIFPKYKPPKHNPFKDPKEMIRAGILSEKAVKWKKHKFKFFIKYQHHYPQKSFRSVARFFL